MTGEETMTFTGQSTIRRLVRPLGMVIPVVVLMLAVACSNGNGDDQDPDQLIDGASARFEQLESVRYALELAEPVSLDARDMFVLRGAEGAAARPGRATAETRVSVAGANVVLELIAIDGEMFLRNVLTGAWERAPVDLQYDPAVIFSDEHGVASVLRLIDDRALDGTESVNGQNTVRVTGTVPTSAVRQMTGNVFDTDSLDVTLWIEPDDYEIHRIQLEDPDQPDEVSWALTLNDHDEAVEITAPDVD
jgi:lipoprotein LprG